MARRSSRSQRFVRPALECLEGRVAPAAGLVVRPVLRPPARFLVTTETGGAAAFTVALASRPRSPVFVLLQSNRPTEGVPVATRIRVGDQAAQAVIFTPLNWNRPQVVRVVGRDDRVRDGNRLYHVTAKPLSADLTYARVAARTVTLVNVDNGARGGITVTRLAAPMVTTEAGRAVRFSVKLTTRPLAPVTIPVASSNQTEGLPRNAAGVPITRLTFTPLNWNVPQFVTVRGVDDAVTDGDQAYAIVLGKAVSADRGYAGLNAADVALVNRDNDTATPSLRDYDGSYTGLYTGTASNGVVTLPVNGTFQFTLNNGVITLTAPTTGTGTLQLNGDASFTVSSEIIPSLTLTGTITKGVDGGVTGSGTFAGTLDAPVVGQVEATGTWTVTRISAV